MLYSLTKSFEIIFINLVIFFNSNFFNIYELSETKVIRIIDGDTFEIYLNRKIEKVRLLGINSPESVNPNKKLECFGLESSEKLKTILENKIIKLEADETQDNRDRYGRLLRYVFLDEININKKLIEEGYGFEYTYKKPYKYQKEFEIAEKIAKENNQGLWNKKNCDY